MGAILRVQLVGFSSLDGASVVFDSDRRGHPFVEELLHLWRFRELVLLWTGRNVKLRYKRSVLGVLWTLLEPLMLMSILTMVFSQLFRFQLAHYPIYLLSGLLLFDFFSRSTLQIVDEVVASDGLASRIYVPRTVFSLATVLSYLLSWVIALVPLLAMVVVLGLPVSAGLWSVPFGMILAALLALGVGLVVATLGASFHDVKLTYQVLLTAWFYATPIIYPLDVVPDQYQPLLRLNPLLHLSSLVRDPVFVGRVAPMSSWLVAFATSASVAILGWWTFTSRSATLEYRS
jgi:ABC-type polysaccharide/polyol phosphate export permease